MVARLTRRGGPRLVAGACSRGCGARSRPGDELTVDLREVPFIDSAGTRLVADLIERIGAGRVRLVVRRGSIVHRAIDLVGVAAAPRVELEARD